MEYVRAIKEVHSSEPSVLSFKKDNIIRVVKNKHLHLAKGKTQHTDEESIFGDYKGYSFLQFGVASKLEAFPLGQCVRESSKLLQKQSATVLRGAPVWVIANLVAV